MSIEEQVREAPSPQAALIVIAQALDTLLYLNQHAAEQQAAADAAWGWDAPPQTARALLSITEHENEVTVDIAPVTDPIRLEQRRALAHAMDLDTNLPNVENAIDVYEKGGPLWLYTGNREFVMSLPYEMRRMMVQDVEQDNVTTAHEMGRDLLKDPDPGHVPSLSEA